MIIIQWLKLIGACLALGGLGGLFGIIVRSRPPKLESEKKPKQRQPRVPDKVKVACVRCRGDFLRNRYYVSNNGGLNNQVCKQCRINEQKQYLHTLGRKL